MRDYNGFRRESLVNPEGAIDRVDYLPPFVYLQAVRDRVNEGKEDTSEKLTPNEKDSPVAACSRGIFDCGQYRTRTCDLLDVNETL